MKRGHVNIFLERGSLSQKNYCRFRLVCQLTICAFLGALAHSLKEYAFTGLWLKVMNVYVPTAIVQQLVAQIQDIGEEATRFFKSSKKVA
jgi:hypothetical protein